MKKKLIVLILVLFSTNFAITQCNNFPYFINEVVSPANEAYFNFIEFEILCINMPDSANLIELQAEIKRANKILSVINDNLYFVKVAIQNARANAENCYCINGQKAVYRLEDKYEKTIFYLDKAIKLMKSAGKTKDLELAKQYISSALSYSLESKKAVDEVVNTAKDEMDSCN